MKRRTLTWRYTKDLKDGEIQFALNVYDFMKDNFDSFPFDF
jgi:hypothetical protein